MPNYLHISIIGESRSAVRATQLEGFGFGPPIVTDEEAALRELNKHFPLEGSEPLHGRVSAGGRNRRASLGAGRWLYSTYFHPLVHNSMLIA